MDAEKVEEEIKYTAGPWYGTPEQYAHNIGEYRMICSEEGKLIGHVWPTSNPQTAANLRLICQSPEMHRALLEIMQHLERYTVKVLLPQDLTGRIKTILEKIRGDTQDGR